MIAPNPESFLTHHDIARELGMNPQTVAKHIKAGRLPGLVLGDGKRVTYRVAVEQWNDFKAGRWRAPMPVAPIATLHRKAS